MSVSCVTVKGAPRLHSFGVKVVVISGDGELLTSAPYSVEGEMMPVRTALAIVVTLMIWQKANNY